MNLFTLLLSLGGMSYLKQTGFPIFGSDPVQDATGGAPSTSWWGDALKALGVSVGTGGSVAGQLAPGNPQYDALYQQWLAQKSAQLPAPTLQTLPGLQRVPYPQAIPQRVNVPATTPTRPAATPTPKAPITTTPTAPPASDLSFQDQLLLKALDKLGEPLLDVAGNWIGTLNPDPENETPEISSEDFASEGDAILYEEAVEAGFIF